jgi:hypothetical protein
MLSPSACFRLVAVVSPSTSLRIEYNRAVALGFERPAELYVDGPYISTKAKEKGWQLTGPATASRVGLEKAYRIEAFDISIAKRKAVSPDGKTGTNCSKTGRGEKR